jgi:hypothetical protein
MDAMTTADVLDQAADEIIRHGWWADGREDIYGAHEEFVSEDDGRVCAALAISRVSALRFDAITKLANFVSSEKEVNEKGSYSVITRWNDAQPNGYAVVGKMRECAASLRNA